jgi:hypothetical protein
MTAVDTRHHRAHRAHRAVRRRALAAGTLTAALTLALLGGAAADERPADGAAERPADRSGASRDQAAADAGGRVPQTSDGVVGPIAAPVAPGARTAARVTNESGFRVGPGLTYRRWDQTDARGQIRAHLLRADLGRDGLAVDYVGSDLVASLTKVKALVRKDGGVGGVNGDFFDISDTGAPVGVGVKDGVTLHGPAQPLGWNISFVVRADGVPVIKRSPTQTTITARPALRVTNVNGPHVIEQGIGLYTPIWGRAPGYRVLEGAPRDNVRQVVVRGGRVVSNTRTVWTDRAVEGRMLLGRGEGAEKLRRELPVGTRTSVVLGTTDAPRVAISGDAELLRDGALVTNDDRYLHPRTAVGIDEDTGDVLLLVVDGRQSFSRGYTQVETARLLRDLGAEDALNLDGGGSSTMVARKTSGRLGVLNSPSDGYQRPVANGLSFGYVRVR